MITWSYSSLTKFEACPRQYQLVKVVKAVVEPPTDATRWGNEVHKAMELRVKEGAPLPTTMVQYEPIAARIANAKGTVFTEKKIGLTQNLQECDFFATDCWYRGIIDVGVHYGATVFLGDYKTGKVKSDHDQLDLFSATYLTLHPEVEVARSAYLWLASNSLTRKDIAQDKTPIIWNAFNDRVNRLEAAYDRDKWIPRPSGLCAGWCPAGREHCEFWSPRRRK